MTMNHEYDRKLITTQILAAKEQLDGHVRYLTTIATSIDDVRGVFVGVDQHAYHTDSAARNLEHTAQGLEDIATGLRAIAGRTLYPDGVHDH